MSHVFLLIVQALAMVVLPPGSADLSEIRLERTACFGSCPIDTVVLRPDGTASYEGKRFVDRIGEYEGTFAQDDFRKLAAEFEAIGFFQLNDRYRRPITDQPSRITSATRGASVKKVDNYGNAGPRNLKDLEDRILKVAQTITWKNATTPPSQPPARDVLAFASPQRPNNRPRPNLRKEPNVDPLNSARFGIDLHARLKGSSGNLIYSPVSLSTALAMVYGGARGETAEQMARVLHYEASPDRLAQAIKATIHQEKAKGYRLDIANRLWGQEGFPFLPAYLALTRENFGAELETLDFKDSETARKTINAWVEAKTQNKIRDLIGSGVLNAQTRWS